MNAVSYGYNRMETGNSLNNFIRAVTVYTDKMLLAYSDVRYGISNHCSWTK